MYLQAAEKEAEPGVLSHLRETQQNGKSESAVVQRQAVSGL